MYRIPFFLLEERERVNRNQSISQIEIKENRKKKKSEGPSEMFGCFIRNKKGKRKNEDSLISISIYYYCVIIQNALNRVCVIIW